MRCRRIHQPGIAQRLFARYFDPAAVAGDRTAARKNVAVKLRGVIRPDDDFAAVAVLCGIRTDDRCRCDVGDLRIRHIWIRAMRIATD